MFKLLPPEEKKILEREYMTRVLIVGAMFLFASVVLGMIALVPAYIFSEIKEKEVATRLAAVQGVISKSDRENLAKELDATKTQITELKLASEESSVVKLLGIVVKNRPRGLKITSFDLSRNENKSLLRITGVAPTRESLVQFNKTLASETLFEKIESPVSDLAKNRDISFSLLITGAF